MAKRIESYFIWYDDDVENEDRFKLFLDLHEKILYKDSSWHFFTEGNYDELRFGSKFKRRVDRFLEKDSRIQKIIPKKDGWNDDQKIVGEFKSYFTSIFHQNTLLALRLYKRKELTHNKHLELEKIMDRTVHSFFNMISLYSDDAILELTIMKDYLIDRAFYMGMMYQTLKENKK